MKLFIITIVFLQLSVAEERFYCDIINYKKYIKLHDKFYNAYKALYDKEDKEDKDNELAYDNLEKSVLMGLLASDCKLHLRKEDEYKK